MRLLNNTSSPDLSDPKIRFHFLTLFPDIFSNVLNSSLLGKAQEKGLVSFHLTQIREFAKDKHRTVDHSPYGGGEGMLLRPDVLFEAWKATLPWRGIAEDSVSDFRQKNKSKVATLLLSPQGETFSQDIAKELAKYSDLILVCGHYEGVDERFIELCVDREISLGDYVLTGGELPALVLTDTIVRLIPGVVGNERSVSEDSLENGLLKYPQYTRPQNFKGLGVPDILLSGHHQAISEWRHKQREERTRLKRPDLWKKWRRD